MTPGSRVELDPAGVYYAALTSRDQPSTGSMTAYLGEPVDPHALQQAVNDLMRRLPFLNARLRHDFFGYFHEILPDPPTIVPESTGHTFSPYFETGTGHAVRALYGERQITVETVHTVGDGRGGMKVMSALLMRYFELLGVATQEPGPIDWSAPLRAEEMEDAYKRYGERRTTESPKSAGTFTPRTAYRFDSSRPTPARFVNRTFSLADVKAAAKAHGATITEYVLAHIFRAIAHERAARGRREPITTSLAIDCRRFFPTDTYRNFATDAPIVMPESEDVAVIIQALRRQLMTIDAEYVGGKVRASDRARNQTRFLPRAATKPLVKMIARSSARQLTTTFSNVGLVKLPKEVEERIEMLDFVFNGQPGSPYAFACVAVGDVLTLTATVRVEDHHGIVERAAEGLAGA